MSRQRRASATQQASCDCILATISGTAATFVDDASWFLPQTAIMACCDMFASLPEEMLSLMKAVGTEPHTSSLLAQLLLKVCPACFRDLFYNCSQCCFICRAVLPKCSKV